MRNTAEEREEMHNWRENDRHNTYTMKIAQGAAQAISKRKEIIIPFYLPLLPSPSPQKIAKENHRPRRVGRNWRSNLLN